MLITKSDFQRELFTGGVDTEGGGKTFYCIYGGKRECFFFLTCTAAHKASLGIVHHTPNDLSKRSNKPGAKSRIFILTLTARLIKTTES